MLKTRSKVIQKVEATWYDTVNQIVSVGCTAGGKREVEREGNVAKLSMRFY